MPKEGLCAKRTTVCQKKDCAPKEGLCAKGRTVCQRKDCVPKGRLCAKEGLCAKRRTVCQSKDCVPKEGLCAKESSSMSATVALLYVARMYFLQRSVQNSETNVMFEFVAARCISTN